MTPPPTPEERARAFSRGICAEDDTVGMRLGCRTCERDLAALIAEEREAGRREGLERARLAVEKCASVHRMRMQSFADDSDRVDSEAVEDDIAIEEVKAEAVEYAASRIRALAEPRTKGDG